MEWFSGNIADAVTTSKERRVIFVVFIDGKGGEPAGNDDTLGQLLNNPLIAAKLSDTTRYLSIRIESGTDHYTQFAQIYRLVPVPSIFFIGQSGQPIEIVAGNVRTVETLQERIAVAEGIFYSSQPAAANTAAAPATNTAPGPPKPAAEEKVEVAKKPAAKILSERELKQSKKDQELLQLKEDRKREKAVDDEARRRVLEQIKMDRLQRQPRIEPTTSPASKPQTMTAVPLARSLPDMTRIQFRKPTGEAVVDTFKSDGFFGDVWKYAKATVVDSGTKDFVLATAMPPRMEFSAEHSDKTLIELNLAPSAVLLVIPLTAPSRISAATGGTLAKFNNFLLTAFWAVVTPMLALWNRLRGRNPPQEPTSRPDTLTGDGSPAISQNIGSEILMKRNLARYNLGPGSSSSGVQTAAEEPAPPVPQKKSTSNVHRLRDYDSDDKDNNTYNGNSTQQM